MTLLANRRSAILLFSLPNCLDSHRTRIVIKEKEISAEVHEVDTNKIPDEIKVISPYDQYPSLVDRELILQNSRVIIEYLDERFPHPPLLPVDPISRAKFRLALNEIEQHWYVKYNELYIGEVLDMKFVDEIKNYLLEIAPMIKNSFFMSDDFGLVDCSLAPLLWRLKSLDFDLASNNKIISEYSERIFDREAFQESLTETEKELF
jgi:RNA polymerase-associated protein|tara:strand:- start:371 stop:988 length:618 start_codon:yes stop_codon:yes gene_type:complete